MKKIIGLILSIMIMFSIAAFTISCNTKTMTYELALITDRGTIDDKSFNQGAWEGLVKYANENNISHKYYQPAEKTDESYLSTIDLAVKGGAKVIVTPGFLFEPAIYRAQDLYPEVKFILLDGTPHDADYKNFRIENNVYSVFYAEEQAGFLAGYAAVKDGYKSLGFMGGMAVPAVKRFGYGYIQGAEYAAKEMGLADNAIAIKYHYTGDFIASPDVQAKAAAWYNAGTEVIFGCGGAVGNSVMAAAEAANKKVIGVDVDQSNQSTTVITSAMKMLSLSVYDGLKLYYQGQFPGKQSVTLAADKGGIGLPQDFSKFNTFNKEAYDMIFNKLKNNEITLVKDKTADNKDVAVIDITVTKIVVTVDE